MVKPRKVVLSLGLEPRTLCLEGRCSIQLSYKSKTGAGGENRTRVISLEGWSNTIIRHPLTVPF